MMTQIAWRLLLAACLALGASCSDDSTDPTADTGVSSDTRADLSGTSDVALPWDSVQDPDLGGMQCTPGAANMCDGFKSFHCVDSKCTACPANKVDCDRTGDCECVGACNGTQCVKGGG